MDCFHYWRTSMRLVWWRIKLDQKWHSQGALEHDLLLPQVLEKEIHFCQGSKLGPLREKALLPIKSLMNGTQMSQAILFLVIMNCTCLALPANTRVPNNFSERHWKPPCTGEGRDSQAHPAPGWALGARRPQVPQMALKWLISFPGKLACVDGCSWARSTLKSSGPFWVSARVPPEQGQNGNGNPGVLQTSFLFYSLNHSIRERAASCPLMTKTVRKGNSTKDPSFLYSHFQLEGVVEWPWQ